MDEELKKMYKAHGIPTCCHISSVMIRKNADGTHSASWAAAHYGVAVEMVARATGRSSKDSRKALESELWNIDDAVALLKRGES